MRKPVPGDPPDLQIYKANRNRFDIPTITVLEVAPSGYYAWLQEPLCQRAIEDLRLLPLIRASHTASEPRIYGAPKEILDLREVNGRLSG